MRTAVLRFGLASVAAAVLVAGCSTGTPGSAFPTTGGSTGGSAAPSGSGTAGPPGSMITAAPKVTTPFDTTKYQQNPCAAITGAQTADIGGGVISHAGNMGGDPTCRWVTTLGTYTQVNLYFLTSFPAGSARGLGYDFSGPALPRLPDIDGQPAILIDLSTKCQVDVGATDDVAYRIETVRTNPAGLCALAGKLAADMTMTMKSGA